MSTEGTEKKKLFKGWKAHHWVIVVLVAVLIVIAVFVYRMHQEKAKLAALIQAQAAKYSDAATAGKLLTDATNAILANPAQCRTASKFAKDFNISYEQAILNMAVAQLTAGGFLAPL